MKKPFIFVFSKPNSFQVVKDLNILWIIKSKGFMRKSLSYFQGGTFFFAFTLNDSCYVKTEFIIFNASSPVKPSFCQNRFFRNFMG